MSKSDATIFVTSLKNNFQILELKTKKQATSRLLSMRSSKSSKRRLLICPRGRRTRSWRWSQVQFLQSLTKKIRALIHLKRTRGQDGCQLKHQSVLHRFPRSKFQSKSMSPQMTTQTSLTNARSVCASSGTVKVLVVTCLECTRASLMCTNVRSSCASRGPTTD